MIEALIVDDNPINHDVIATLLETVGLKAIAIDSPRLIGETLDSATNIRVIFLDLEFPQHDGFELLKELKADPRLVGIPIVAYSVHTSEIDRARRLGFHSFLGKPLNAQAFASQLERILNNEHVWEV